MSTQNPYASPQTDDVRAEPLPVSATNCWRQGQMLIVAKDARLPARCVKCNAPAAGKPRKVLLTWYPLWAYLGLLGGVFPLLLIMFVVQKKMPLQARLCAAHTSRRRWGIAIGWLGALAAIAIAIFGGIAAPADWVALPIVVAIVLFFVALAISIIMSRIVTAKRVNKRYAWVRGVAPEILAPLPEFPADIR